MSISIEQQQPTQVVYLVPVCIEGGIKHISQCMKIAGLIRILILLNAMVFTVS